MKRIITAGLVLLMVGLVGAPGYTLETKVTGTFTYDGVVNIVSEDEDEVMTYREMELELLTQTKINDKITLHSQTAILDTVVDSKNDYDGDNLSVERVWVDIVTSVGLLSIGRMEVSTWGTTFGDNETDGDRLKLVTPMTMGAGKLYLAAVAEKRIETVGFHGNKFDNEVYYLTATYATRTYRYGLLLGYYDYGDAEDVDLPQGVKYDLLAVVPYFSGKVGPVMLNAEVSFTTGQSFIRDPAIAVILGREQEVDIEGLAYWLEVGYPMDNANVELGYVYLSGDDQTTPEDESSAGAGEDWEKLLILTSDDAGVVGPLQQNEDDAGCSLFYLGGSYTVSEAITVDGIVGMATADEPDAKAAGTDDDMGVEINLGLNWKIMDNLEYSATLGYLMAGDYFKGGYGDADHAVATTDAPDVYALYNEFVISF